MRKAAQTNQKSDSMESSYDCFSKSGSGEEH